MPEISTDAERARLEEARDKGVPWRKWVSRQGAKPRRRVTP
jgi:hypothetical protein